MAMKVKTGSFVQKHISDKVWEVTLKFKVYHVKDKRTVMAILPTLTSSHDFFHEIVIPKAIIKEIK